MQMVDKICYYCDECDNETDVIVDFYYAPAERMTRDYPGCGSEVEDIQYEIDKCPHCGKPLDTDKYKDELLEMAENGGSCGQYTKERN